MIFAARIGFGLPLEPSVQKLSKNYSYLFDVQHFVCSFVVFVVVIVGTIAFYEGNKAINNLIRSYTFFLFEESSGHSSSS